MPQGVYYLPHHTLSAAGVVLAAVGRYTMQTRTQPLHPATNKLKTSCCNLPPAQMTQPNSTDPSYTLSVQGSYSSLGRCSARHLDLCAQHTYTDTCEHAQTNHRATLLVLTSNATHTSVPWSVLGCQFNTDGFLCSCVVQCVSCYTS